MSDLLLRRARGAGIALVVLAMSAGAAFAAAPSLQPASSPAAEEATETPEPTESPEPTETPEATEAPEPTETPEATEAPEPTETPASNGPDQPDAAGDTGAHGALVSAAAQMETPAGFSNHGAFVSCVAHMKDATLATIDWTAVTPDSCGAAQPGQKQAHSQSGTSHGHGKGAAKRNEHAPGS